MPSDPSTHTFENNEDENLIYSNAKSSPGNNQISDHAITDLVGHASFESLINDPSITEIMVNNCDDIFIEKNGLIEKSHVHFDDNAQLIQLINRIAAQVGRRVDEMSPMVDARLPNGYRINATIPPLSLDGPSLTIRKFSMRPFTAQDLIANGTQSAQLTQFLKACVEAQVNLVVSGGTGSGKTTYLNLLSSFIPDSERVITIEDTAELRLDKINIVRLEKRPPNIQGRGEVSIRQLVINALRMRPDRIVVGECRGGEALDMLQAMNTGHDGSMTTVHSNGPRDTLRRIETMVLMAGMDLPLKAIREQVASSIELIVHLERMRDGSRKVVLVSEVQGMEGDTIVMQDLFMFEQTGTLEGVILGQHKPTGMRPRFMEKFITNNVPLPENILDKYANRQA